MPTKTERFCKRMERLTPGCGAVAANSDVQALLRVALAAEAVLCAPPIEEDYVEAEDELRESLDALPDATGEDDAT